MLPKLLRDALDEAEVPFHLMDLWWTRPARIRRKIRVVERA